MRAILLLIAALIAGPFCIWTGIKEYKNSKALQAQGKVTTAQVVDGEERVSRKGRRSYSLTVSFAPEGGAAVTQKGSVSRETYERAAQDRTVKLTYLPSDPTVFQFGEKAEAKSGLIIFGAVVLFGALGFLGYLFVQWKSSQGQSTVAEQTPGSFTVNAGTTSAPTATTPSTPEQTDLPKAA